MLSSHTIWTHTWKKRSNDLNATSLINCIHMGKCGCKRGMWCCETCSTIKNKIDLELHKAMATGNWSMFDELRYEFEKHMLSELSCNTRNSHGR